MEKCITKGVRDINIDCAKGLLIILVVLGHILAPLRIFAVNYIYLFHMPAFFILSGMCYKEKKIKDLILKTFIPFLIYIIIMYFYGNIFIYKTSIKLILFGGSKLGGIFGAFWFIPCLFFAKILFIFLQKLKISENKKIILILFLYIINIISLKYLTYEKIYFWNIDISFVCLFYYSLGYYIKEYKYNNQLTVILTIITLLSTILFKYKKINIIFNMKLKRLFFNPIFQIIFPLSITIYILNMINIIKDNNFIKKAFAYLGKASIVIMYTHIVIYTTLIKYLNAGYFIQIILSIILPLIAYYIFSKNKYTKKLFIG